MALGRRRTSQQGELFLTSADLPQSPGHAFYDRLNEILAGAEFDRFVEDLCRPHYADEVGRPSLPPGTYFRMLFVGYFEGLDSQRGIAWRCADSFSLRAFLAIPFGEASPDHSSLTKIRQRLPDATKGGGGTPEFMSTHPSHETRIADLKNWLPDAEPLYKANPAPDGDEPLPGLDS